MARLITAEHAATFERCMTVGGVAVCPSDTVYGLACDVGDERAVDTLYALKGRRPDKPAAVMFFSLELALGGIGAQGPRTIAAVEALLPGPVTLLLPNPDGRYPLACADGDGDAALGLRVPLLCPEAAALEAVRWPVLQSSANVAGGPDPCRVHEVPNAIVDGADLVLDAGPLPGTPSTVIDLRGYEDLGVWTVLRAGAMPPDEIDAALGG
jgi:L-threonylcarbamoyladenylate synthase